MARCKHVRLLLSCVFLIFLPWLPGLSATAAAHSTSTPQLFLPIAQRYTARCRA
jgi:short subunit fatty acids transporter